MDSKALARLTAPRLLGLLVLAALPALGPAAGYPMRLTSAALAAPLLRGAGLEVSREGTVLRWQESRFDVAEECSGLRKLWAALVLAGGLAALRGLGARQTAVLLAAAAVAAAAGNALRVAALFELEIVLGRESRALHDATGLGAFAVVAVGIVVLARGLTAAENRSRRLVTPSPFRL